MFTCLSTTTTCFRVHQLLFSTRAAEYVPESADSNSYDNATYFFFGCSSGCTSARRLFYNCLRGVILWPLPILCA